jgi:hypothetical protein
MLFLIIFFITMMFVGRIVNHVATNMQAGTSGPCKQHKWIYDAEGHLFCEVCKKRPGYEGRDSGGYDG